MGVRAVLVALALCSLANFALALSRAQPVPKAAEVKPEAQIALPSGQSVSLIETRFEPDEALLRLRYLAPAIGDAKTRPAFDLLTRDLEHLCTEVGLAEVANQPQPTAQIIVSLSEKPVVFGEISPEVEQVFEAFHVENGACILEVF